jgi:hypothetical protein
LALALAVPFATAAEVSREGYVARVESICKVNTEANARIFSGVRDEVRAKEFERASRAFERGAASLGKAIQRISAVPMPPADTAKLKEWIGYLKIQKAYLGKVAGALAGGDEYRAQTLVVRLNRNASLANRTVRGFGFDYCRIDSSRFS